MTYKRIGFTFGGVLAVLAMTWFWLEGRSSAEATQRSPLAPVQTAGIGGAFSLIDHRGDVVSDRDFGDKVLLLMFGYTFCPDVCPTSLQGIAQALDLLGTDAEEVQALFISVDPDRDTPEVLGSYVSAFHPSLIGLTGTPEQIRQVTADYRVYYAKAGSDSEDYLIDHSAYIYLVGAGGQVLTYLRHDAEPEAIAAVVEPLLASGTKAASAH